MAYYETRLIVYTETGSGESRRTQLLGELDVYDSDDLPLALNFAVKNIEDISESKGSYSKTFDIPATPKNNKTLQHLWSDNLLSIEKYISGEVKARIEVNGQIIFTGSLTVKSTILDQKPQGYEITIFGDNNNWVSIFSNQYMCEDMDGYDNDALYDWTNAEWDNINNSVTDSDDSAFCIPVSCWGVWEEDFNGFPNIVKKVRIQEVTPALFVRPLLMYYFAQAGYTVVSNFFNTDYFKKLCIPTDWGNFVANEQASVQIFECLTRFYYDWSVREKGDINGDGVIWEPTGQVGYPGAQANVWPKPWTHATVGWGSVQTGFGSSAQGSPVNYKWMDASGVENPNNPCPFDPTYPYPFSQNAYCGIIMAKFGNTSTSTFMHTGMTGGVFYMFPMDTQMMDGGSLSEGISPNQGDVRIARNNYSSGLPGPPSSLPVPAGYGYWSGYNQSNQINGWGGGGGWNYGPPSPFTNTFGTTGNTSLDSRMNTWHRWKCPQTNNWKFTAELSYIATGRIEWVVEIVKYTGVTFWNDNYYGTPNVDNGAGSGAYYDGWGGPPPNANGDGTRTVLDSTTKVSSHSGYAQDKWEYHEVDIDTGFITVDQGEIITLEHWVNCKAGTQTHSSYQSWPSPTVRVVGRNFTGNECNKIGDQQGCTNMPADGAARENFFKVERGNAATAGDEIMIREQLPCDVLKSDFVAGLTGMFNLYWTTNEQEKKVYVEPYDQFFKGRSDALDWTEKLDFTEPHRTTYLVDRLGRDILFRYTSSIFYLKSFYVIL